MTNLDLKEELRYQLILLASKSSTSHYSEMMSKFGLDNFKSEDRTLFEEVLIEIANEELSNNRPWINCLLLGHEKNYTFPNIGFNFWVKQHYKNKYNSNWLPIQKQFQTLKKWCFDYWGDKTNFDNYIVEFNKMNSHSKKLTSKLIPRKWG